MKHLKSEFDKLTFKDVIVYSIALFCQVAAVVSIFLSIFIPPKGEIHSSVLTYFGLSSSFVGTLLGVSYYYSGKAANLERMFADYISKLKNPSEPKNSVTDESK